MALKNFAALALVVVLIGFSTLGWIGLFPYSWLAVPIIAFIFIKSINEWGFGLSVGLLFSAAAFPGLIAYFKSLDDVPESGKFKIIETLDLYDISDDGDVLMKCSSLSERSILPVIKRSILLGYNIDPITSFFMDRQIESQSEVEKSCVEALEEFRKEYPEAYDYLDGAWPDMPKTIVQ